MKQILVIIDGSAVSQDVQSYALRLAKSFNVRLKGLGIVDTPWLTAVQPEPLGAAAYKVHHDDEITGHVRAQMNVALDAFHHKCTQEGVTVSTNVVEGFPAQEIYRVAHEYDALVMGQTSSLHQDLEEENNLVLTHTARDSARPIFVIPQNKAKGETILIAYDGSAPASKTIHLYFLLGLAKNKKVHIISVNKKEEDARAHCQQVTRLANSYGINVQSHPLVSRTNIADIIMEKATELHAHTVVVGSFGQSAFTEALFGSVTQRLLERTKIPLFIHH
ncbi:MAG: universal stress protein [Alphaproteobacteria bacterium]|nr:MAG: universal stress protein [Alphaproteobacteria bacterium]